MTMPSKIWASEDVSDASDEWKMAMWHGHQNLIKPVRTPYIRADIAEELARALEDIARTKYGLQGIMEDYEGEEYERNAKEYYASLVRRYERSARNALSDYHAATKQTP